MLVRMELILRWGSNIYYFFIWKGRDGVGVYIPRRRTLMKLWKYSEGNFRDTKQLSDLF
jgi:hypothetical protein